MADVQTVMMRTFGAMTVRLYRASGGRVMGSMRGVPVLLLTVKGRKSGVEHTSVVSYFENEGGYVVTGSAGGAPKEPQWFKNLRHTDRAVIEVGKQRFEVTVTVAGPEQRPALWQTLITKHPFFAKYQEKVTREIPMAVLTRVA